MWENVLYYAKQTNEQKKNVFQNDPTSSSDWFSNDLRSAWGVLRKEG